MLFNNSNIFINTLLSVGLVFSLNYIRKRVFQDNEPNFLSFKYPRFAPQRYPIIGHVLQFLKPIPAQEIFRQWSQQIGPIFTVQLGSKYWIILNSSIAVKNLIVDKSMIYSSRDLPSVLVNDLMNGVDRGGGFAFYPYGPQWRNLRRIAHSGLTKKRINDYQPILDNRRSTLIKNIYQANNKSQKKDEKERCISLTQFIEHYTMTSILAIVFGNMCQFQPGDPKLHQAFTLTERIASIFGPLEQMAEFFPFLQLFWNQKTKYIQAREEIMDFYGGLLEEFKQRLEEEAHNNIGNCFMKDILQGGELTDLQMVNFVALFVGAGSETTSSTLEWMIALLTNHPEIQERAYKEIKENIGLDRLPTSDDESSLPYIQCVIHETLRLRPPAPLSLPHATSENDKTDQWHIPKNTTIIINLHAIQQDPDRYPQPDQFIPERHWDYVIKHTTSEQRFSQSVEDRPHLAFSTGRRVCVGIHLAEKSIFMAISALVACFRFERESMDQYIDTIHPKDIRSPTFTPRPYKVKVIPRHDHVRSFF
ncbi:unnamed protein product [Cunninghamella echinulata]